VPGRGTNIKDSHRSIYDKRTGKPLVLLCIASILTLKSNNIRNVGQSPDGYMYSYKGDNLMEKNKNTGGLMVAELVILLVFALIAGLIIAGIGHYIATIFHHIETALNNMLSS
jgi:hypothetical protein